MIEGRKCSSRVVQAFACVVVLALAAACGSDDTSRNEGATTTSTAAAAVTTTATPKQGGSLTIAMFAELTTFDPIGTNGSGEVGGTEQGAIYDHLMVWDTATSKYVPRIAESVTPNADLTLWTIKLRSGVTFSDGTAYDAAAVKFNIDRQRNESPTNKGYLNVIKDVSVVDPLTVSIALTEPWASVPALLAGAVGMIASPTAVQKLGKAQFAVAPVGAGAGPFEFVSFKPGEAIVLKKRASYWAGSAYLDELKFVTFKGGQATYDALQTGTVDVGGIREPAPSTQSVADKWAGYDIAMPIGELYLINNGLTITCAGQQPDPVCKGQADGAKVVPKTPGSDPDVRKAIALAVDIDAVDQRANDGKGSPAHVLFGKPFPWPATSAAPKADPEAAKKLVAAAKARGWDGKLRIVCNANSPSRVNATLAVETMLKAVGIDVNVVSVADTAAVVAQVITKKDYDLACWGLTGTPDDWSQVQIDSFLRSTSASNRTGYSSAAMDANLLALRTANTDAAKAAAYNKIAEQWYADVPGLVLTSLNMRVVWSNKVHGIAGGSISTVLFDKAWRDS
jgi:peptide/nickel transport system substrate-binding protein